MPLPLATLLIPIGMAFIAYGLSRVVDAENRPKKGEKDDRSELVELDSRRATRGGHRKSSADGDADHRAGSIAYAEPKRVEPVNVVDSPRDIPRHDPSGQSVAAGADCSPEPITGEDDGVKKANRRRKAKPQESEGGKAAEVKEEE